MEEQNIMICIHYGYNNTLKCLIPSIGYNLGIGLDDPEMYTKIINVIQTKEIKSLYLDGSDGIIQILAYNIQKALPELEIIMENLEV